MKQIVRTVTVPCHTATLDPVRTLVQETLTEIDLPRERKELIQKCLAETVESLARYSDQMEHHHDLTVTIHIGKNQYRVIVTESRNDYALADTLESETLYRIGLSTARAIMDEISYTYQKGSQNELELIHAL